MIRRPFVIATAIFVTLIAVGCLILYSLARHVPEFYLQAAIPPGPERQQYSKEVERQVSDIYDHIKDSNDGAWHAYFTDQQVNSWFAEDFLHKHYARFLGLPAEVKEPRMVFRPGTILLAFQYGEDSWSSIVSIEAKVWISPHEPNVVVVQIEDLRAGALPLTLKMLQDRITESARTQNIEVNWYRNEGKPVALLRFQANKREPTFQLQELELGEGTLSIRGRSTDPEVRRAAMAPFEFPPPSPE